MHHTTEIVTRYCESDALGHINSVSYFIYLEQARVEFILENKIVKSIDQWPFVLVSTNCDYKKQIYINDLIVIKTFVKDIGRSSFKLGHEFIRQAGNELLAYAEAVIVHYDFHSQKSSPIPKEMLIEMEKFLQVTT
ncbi:acyl-CoA thioesterase [Cytobacillus firmus]|uniref:acyl-CoA thioesterase n=1 Tax=Cytobacillus firmus TaxID=1399 RepID=UPI0036BFD3F7